MTTAQHVFRLDASSGVPFYRQIIDQVLLAVGDGRLKAGTQLPTVRQLAVDLSVNLNTVAKAYRELEHEGVIELRHGAGAFVAASALGRRGPDRFRAAQAAVTDTVKRLRDRGLSDEEIRRLFESELSRAVKAGGHRG